MVPFSSWLLIRLPQDAPNASSFAQLAVSHDRYNARALVNMGNALAAGGEPERAKEMYLEVSERRRENQ